MKLSDASIDPVRFEQGEWVKNIPEMGDLAVKVRGMGNADWRRMQSRLVAAVPRNKRVGNQVDTEEMDKIYSTLLLECSLLDWSGIEDKDGAAVPYSKAQANEILTNPVHRRVRDAIFWASTTVGEGAAATEEVLVKN